MEMQFALVYFDWPSDAAQPDESTKRPGSTHCYVRKKVLHWSDSNLCLSKYGRVNLDELYRSAMDPLV